MIDCTKCLRVWLPALFALAGGLQGACVAAPGAAGQADASNADAVPLPLAIKGTDPRVRYEGRFDTSDPAGPRCAWSASSVTVRFTGTGLNAVLGDTGASDLYQVVVDDRPTAILTTRGGSHVYSLLREPSAGTHTVTLTKRTEAFFGTTQFQGFQLASGGKILNPPPRPARRLEVIGDSISCGYGNEGKDQHEHFSAQTENAYLSYGAVAAREVGAEYVCVAWSGRRMYPNNTMDEVYGRTLPQDPNSRWDFSRWTPQAVVIALGTNDINGGIPDGDKWVKGYEDFIARVRKKYGQAAIYCASSPMLDGDKDATVRGYLHRIVQDENAHGHKNVRFLDFATQQASNGFGADWHPSVKTDQIMADTLTTVLRDDLGWTPVSRPSP